MKSKWIYLLAFLLLIGLSPCQVSAYNHDTSDDNPIRHAFPQPIIIIDAGHGGIDGGTSYGDILEKDINLSIGRRLYMLLRSQGYIAVLNRTGDYALSEDNRWMSSRSRHLRDLAQRKGLSEELTTAVVVSVHVNWARNKSKRGPLVLHQNEGRSALLASAIQDALDPLYGTSSYARVGKPFYLLKHIDDPAVIVETGYMSNSEDRTMLLRPTFQMRIAEAIAGGLTHFFTVT